MTIRQFQFGSVSTMSLPAKIASIAFGLVIFLPIFALLIVAGIVAAFVFGVLLLFPTSRHVAGWGLILLLIAIFPANIYLAQTNGAALNTTPLIAWGRLPFQFVFIAIAYWHTKL